MPAPASIVAAISDCGIPAVRTLAEGDDARDIGAARGAGVAAAPVLTGMGRATAGLIPLRGVPVYDDLVSFARALLARHPDGGIE
jgi:phosphoglycolate phosphatase-like HAD superfamily hydrolase